MARTPPPSAAFLLSHPAHLIACGFGSGLSPIAPGTAGSLFAWLSYAPLRMLFPADAACAVFLLLAFALGVSACQITGRALGEADHRSIVWDEIVPFWGVLMMTPADWRWQLVAFVCFRCYDIIKPPPASHFDAKMKNGLGVMMDDLIAAAYTVFSLAVIKAALGPFFI
jgi:phosphatidylglycerophosphatase A